MRPIPGTADAQRAGAYDDGLCLPTPTTAPVACFFATEDSLRETSHGDSPDMSPDVSFHRSRLRRKPSPDAISSRSQLPSPTPTGHSIASLSSSVLDSEFDMDTPDMHARPSSIPESSASVGPSADSVSIIGSAISSCGSSRAPSASPPPYQRRGRPASPGSSAHNHSPRDDATPQFIMPSLAIPQRRPFSDAGKSVGKLKILVAGRPGTSTRILKLYYMLTSP